MKKRLTYRRLLLSLSTCGVFSLACTAYALTNADSSFLYWPTRGSLAAAGGTLGIANGDLMLPLFGNNDNAFLLDGQAKYGNDTNSAISGGLGFRHVYHDARILGGYLYVDRNRFVNEGDLTTENFWFVSPGIESMGNLMDLRINGYIPVSSQQENVGTSQAITFSGHSEFDTTINNLNSTGPGIDGEIGLVKVPHIPHLRAYVGGYHFEPKDQDNITGASGRVEFPLNHYVALTAVDTYDNNVHNTFQVGIRLTLGGMNDDVSGKDIQRRIVDPINRNLSTQYTGTAQPVIVSQSTGNSRLLMDNIYFFTSNDGTAFNAAQGTNNCTFEHPCSGTSFTQSTVNSIGTITNNANLFFNPGGYSLNGQLSLVEGQSIFGRSFDYTQPAVGTERAMFIGSFLPHDNNTFDSIRLVNDGNQQFGFFVDSNIQNLTFNNVQVGGDANQSYQFSMFFNGSDSATITNSQIIFNGTNKTFLSGNTATGLLFDTSDITIDNLDIEMNAVVSGGTFIITGINSVTGASNPTPIKLSNSTINVNLTDTNSIAAEADGIVDTNDIYEIFNSQISTNVNVTNNSGSADAFTRAIDINGSTAVLDIQDSQVSANASATGSTTGNSDSAAIRTSFMTAANIENSQLVSTANAQGTTGAFATSTGFISNFTPVTVTNSVLDVRSNTSGTTTGSSQAVGMSLNGGSLNQTGNTFNVVATGTTPTSQTDIIGP